MEQDTYKYTLKYNLLGVESEEECYIRKDEFYPYGVIKEGLKIRGEFGFMEIVAVFEIPSIKYGKFIAKSITYDDMAQSLTR